jgi:hypothetical protein
MLQVFPGTRQGLQVSLLILCSPYIAPQPASLVYVVRDVKAIKNSYIEDENHPDTNADEGSEAQEDSEVERDLNFTDAEAMEVTLQPFVA